LPFELFFTRRRGRGGGRRWWRRWGAEFLDQFFLFKNFVLHLLHLLLQRIEFAPELLCRIRSARRARRSLRVPVRRERNNNGDDERLCGAPHAFLLSNSLPTRPPSHTGRGLAQVKDGYGKRGIPLIAVPTGPTALRRLGKQGRGARIARMVTACAARLCRRSRKQQHCQDQ